MHVSTVPAGTSLAAALAALPPGEACTLLLGEGVFAEKIELSRPHTRLVGVSAEKTRIVWQDCANAIHPADGLPFNTFRTATLRVSADDVALENLSVENAATDPKENGQCVALYVYGDRFLCRDCALRSTQDTLFCGPLPDDLVVRYQGFLPDPARLRAGELTQTFLHCTIAGSADFIFGCGDARFFGCTLESVFDGRDGGFVAAPAHSLKQTRGFLFAECSFVGKGVSDASVFLARPWRDFGLCSFVNCRLGSHIAPALFDPWNDTARYRTARFAYCGLSGAKLSPVPWSRELPLSEAEALLSLAR